MPTFRGRRVLGPCLEALRRQTLEQREVIVVDDGSADGTAAWVRDRFPEVRVVALERNQGFCRAANAGLRAARGGVVALLNDDTVADPHWLAALVRGLDDDPGLGFCASKMVSHADPRILDGAGDGYSRHGLAFRVGRGEADDGRHAPRAVLWASGGACAYRREVLDAIGLLDEGFHAYYEDVDLGLRATAAGWRGRYVPESRVAHVGSFSDAGARSTLLTTRNALLVVAKHWPRRLILRNLPWLAYGQLRGAAWAARNGRGRLWAQGLVSALRAWPAARAAGAPVDAPWAGELADRYPFGSPASTMARAIASRLRSSE